MNGLEFAFEPSAWELTLDSLTPGGTLPASRFLALMEDQCEDAVQDALAELDEKDVLLDISDLPNLHASGETALRLRLEEQLVRQGELPHGLEETDPLRLCLEEIAGLPACGDPALLAEQCRAGEESARPQLAGCMLSMVVQQSCALVGRGVLLMDLIQEGSLGLWQGILLDNGGDICAQCGRAIARALAKTVTLHAREDGVGQRMRSAMEAYRAADQRLLTELGRNPTLEEIALEIHMTADEASMVADMLENARRMERAKSSQQSDSPQPEDSQAVEDTAYFQMRQRIGELLSVLPEADAALLSARFGLDGGKPLSPEEAGRKLGLTFQEVLEREASALALLRNAQ